MGFSVRPVHALALLVALLLQPFAGSAAPRTKPVLAAAAVAAPDAYGAQVASEILHSGGNAVDAAVATGFALAVSYPEAGNIGGGGFMTLYVERQPYFLDYRERAPLRANRDMYLDPTGEVVPDLSLVGPLAVGVPGTVRGLWLAHQRFGRLSWRRDLAPAIRLARDGILVRASLADSAREATEHFSRRTNFARYFGGLKPGQRWRQPELAAVLERIARDGPDGFYAGRTAELLLAQVARGHGILSSADLTAYRAAWRTPLTAHWRDFEIITAPPPSSGGIGLVQLLRMKDDLGDAFEGVALDSAQYVHLLAELDKLVFADRAQYLGDPDAVPVPVKQLIDPTYLAARAATVDRLRPTPTPQVNAGLGGSHQTTHFSVVDRWGNAVSNTYTLNDDFGSGVVVDGGGFLLNNEMDDFSAKPGAPNLFGVVGNAANAIQPGRRPLSSMTPTILLKGGEVALVIGTPGGSRIFTSVFQVICNLYDFGLPLPQALAAARVHHQLLPQDLLFEEPFAKIDPAVRTQLERRGYRFEDQGWNGDIEAILIDGREPIAGSDPRGDGVSRIIR